MDLKSIINNPEAVDRSVQTQTTPITPIQPVQSQHSFREQGHHLSAISSKHLSHDYGLRGHESFTSPTEYQRAYQRPSAPTPLQTPSQQDPRSPAGNSQYSVQSPYSRQSIGASQYPFPHSQSPQSPAHPQPHPNSLQRPDGYPQHQPLPPHLQPHPYVPSPAPQMPATPVSGNPYSQHQRSVSLQSHSTSTPTSAHSQGQQYGQFPQDSPVSAGSFQHTHLPQHQRHPSQPERQPSQPSTPLGPPISNTRPLSGVFPQPLSPYQQRPPSSGAVSQHLIPRQNSTPPSQPHDPRSSEIPNHNNSRSVLNSEPSKPQYLRDRSVSVSPKTQLPGLPRAEVVNIEPQPMENGYVATPKRKMEDRDDSEPAASAPVANGAPSTQSRTTSPQQPSRKRIRYNEPPIWARSFTGRVKDTNALLSVKRPLNVKLEHSAQPPNGHQADTGTVSKPTQIAQPDFQGQLPLGAWEPSLTGIRPYEEVSKRVADWLFGQVVSRPDVGELASRGVEIEIEAKLGQLIDKGTNERYRLPVVSECVLAETGNVAFKSSVTETNHKELNEFLNGQVKETHPENPHRTKQRVQVVYAHRRERDKFYELPPSHYATLPACMRNALNARQTVKVRVTHDQKTGLVLAKIIKARVDSMDVFNPAFALDCRISINLEMKYDGELGELIATSQNSRIPDRNKDRLSYTHSHYQIDLTQVTTVTDAGVVTEKEHELEIEVSAAAVREQGRLALSREPNQYGELIEGLMDNVRVLARHKA